MCGLIYAKKKLGGSVAKVALKRYHKQSHRGKEGYGYIPFEDGYVRRVERFTTEKDFIAALSKETTNEVMIHHRAPTSTENLIGTTHPVVVKEDSYAHNYYLIHNGTLRNHYALRAEHKKRGLRYRTEHKRTTYAEFDDHEEYLYSVQESFLDSESLAHEVAMYMEGIKSSIDTVGGVAFMCIQTEKDGRIVSFIYGKNSNRTLVREVTESRKGKKKNSDHIIIKSEGGGVQLTDNVLYVVDYASGAETEIQLTIGTPDYVQPKSTHRDWGPNYQEQNRSMGFLLPNGERSKPAESQNTCEELDFELIRSEISDIDSYTYQIVQLLKLSEDELLELGCTIQERIKNIQEILINYEQESGDNYKVLATNLKLELGKRNFQVQQVSKAFDKKFISSPYQEHIKIFNGDE